MNQTNSSFTSLWLFLVKGFQTVMQFLQKYFTQFRFFSPNLLQIIQLTFLYSFAVVDLVYSILTTIFSFGEFPELLLPFSPFIHWILESPLLRIFASPEKVFFFSYVAIELMVVRSVFKFSKLVRYNILLLFSVLMLQGLAISYWDFLFHRQISDMAVKWSFDQGFLFATDKTIAIFFFFLTFLFFFFGYVIFYIEALQGKFFTHPKFTWLTDSVSFWLRVKTSTMKFGKRKKK